MAMVCNYPQYISKDKILQMTAVMLNIFQSHWLVIVTENIYWLLWKTAACNRLLDNSPTD